MIVVESAGFQTTVQDLGRPGYGALGVSPSGAADPIAFRIANLLVGNPPNAAALEMTLSGGRFRFESGADVAVTGATAEVRLDSDRLEPWSGFQVHAGQRLAVGSAQSGLRMYLAVRGGIDVPRIMGSASTHLLSGLGGLDGRALKKGDTVAIGPSAEGFKTPVLRRETLARLAPRRTLRVTRGLQAEWFSDEDRARFITNAYRVTQEANRMGLRLEGPALSPQSGHHMITEGVPLGAVQIPPNGQPIVLFVEQQTTGGYPKIANVVSADLASLGQLRPGDDVRFEWVSIRTALALLFEQESLLDPEELFR